NVGVAIDGKEVRLTNLRKVFWSELGLTKGDLLQYYAAVADVLLPHIRNRAMVMKRYPHGAAGDFFFMKRAPSPRPDWIEICSIDHGSENIIDFPMIQDRAALMWVINLGCIDLNQWYATCDDVDRPDYLHFDLDPGVGATFDRVLETALVVRGALETLEMPSLVSIYSVRPRPEATVSTPVTWKEVERGIRIEDFTVENVPGRAAKLGDLWKPLLHARGRFNLGAYV